MTGAKVQGEGRASASPSADDFRDARRIGGEGPDHPVWEAEVGRVSRIGRARLLAWWATEARRTRPATYGQSDSKFCAAVAFALTQPNPRAVWSNARLSESAFFAAARRPATRRSRHHRKEVAMTKPAKRPLT